MLVDEAVLRRLRGMSARAREHAAAWQLRANDALRQMEYGRCSSALGYKAYEEGRAAAFDEMVELLGGSRHACEAGRAAALDQWAPAGWQDWVRRGGRHG